MLAVLQAAISLALFHDFIFGDKFFAFKDIGSDTFTYHVPVLAHLATPANWASAWSFNVGLGGVLPVSLNPFDLLGIAAGPDRVLDMRIWVYVAKIFAGGAAFYGFLLATGVRREVAVVVALGYSFCGYVVTDGQWDTSSTDFVVYALILWAIARHASHRNTWLIPLAIAIAAYSGAFIFSVGVFIAYAFAAATIASERPLATSAIWLRSILPQCAIGLLLAAPVVVPLVFQLLDSPRVTGAQSGFSALLGEVFSINDPFTVLNEFAGLFHKNILGVGNFHAGWMNYLESPAFFVGVLPLMTIPQLWLGSRADRRILAAGSLAIGLFIALPAIRYIAFGFGLDYFRVNNLWISILLLAMFARALESAAERGIHRWLFGGTVACLAIGLVTLESQMRPLVSVPHAMKILAFLGLALLLGLALGRVIRWRRFAPIALGFVALEAIVINYPSFHADRRVVARQTPGYNDGTVAALAFLRARDAGFYRVEKNFNSVALCDALAQGYMGVKSYGFQSASVVGLFSELGLIPRSSPVKNFTNWLPNFGGRYVLNSLVGVKYMITRTALDWPGFHRIHEVGGMSIFENDLALPLGVVYDQQLRRDRFAMLSVEAKDIAMTNAAIVDDLRGKSPRIFDVRQFTRESTDWLTDNYFTPARQLQRRGMIVDRFSHGHITGKIASDAAGVLVFSIPYAKGWSVAVDAAEQPVFRANLGMLATDVSRGEHRIELRYSLPGLIPGLFIGLLGLLGIWALGMIERRPPPTLPSAPGAGS